MAGEPRERPRRARLLVVDDDPDARSLVRELVSGSYVVIEAADAGSAVRTLDAQDPDLLLLDLDLGPGPDGFTVLDWVRRHESGLPVIVLSLHDEPGSVVRAMKAGATHFIPKPAEAEELLERIDIALRERRRAFAIETQRAPVKSAIIGVSPAIERVRQLAQAAASSDLPVLILGETGTGKSLVARCIHEWGPRSSRPFKDVNIAGLPTSVLDSELFGHERGAFTGAERRRRGLFELASGGTMLLDEIGDLPAEFQVKLLKVVETGAFRRVGGEADLSTDVRILTATHRELESMISSGAFRSDLYHRLAGLTIRIPPLRTRTPDISVLARAFLGEEMKIDDQVMVALISRPWPGNVRELHQTLRRASLFSQDGALRVADLEVGAEDRRLNAHRDSNASLMSLPYDEALHAAQERFRREYLERLLERWQGNVSRAARESGLSRSHLHVLLRELGLKSGAPEE